jgi:hypothetical protein
MPGVSANTYAIPEFPQLPRHFRKLRISTIASDICISQSVCIRRFNRKGDNVDTQGGSERGIISAHVGLSFKSCFCQ